MASDGGRGGGRGGRGGGNGPPGRDRHALEQKGDAHRDAAEALAASGDLQAALAAATESAAAYTLSARARHTDGLRATGARRGTLSAYQDQGHLYATQSVNLARTEALVERNELRAQVTLAPPRAPSLFDHIAAHLPASPGPPPPPASAWTQRAAAAAVASTVEAFPVLLPPGQAAAAPLITAAPPPRAVAPLPTPRPPGGGQLRPLGPGTGRPMTQTVTGPPAQPGGGRGRGRR